MTREIKFRSFTPKNQQLIYEGWNKSVWVSKHEIFAQGDDAKIIAIHISQYKKGNDFDDGNNRIFTNRK